MTNQLLQALSEIGITELDELYMILSYVRG